MVVIVVEAAPRGLRGLLTRWLIEPRAGVYVGTVSARVRELLWMEVKKYVGEGNAVMVRRANNEQGFVVTTHGDNPRTVVDRDGLQLICYSS